MKQQIIKQQIKEKQDLLLSKQADAKKRQNEVRILTEEIKKLKQRLYNSSQKGVVSDHCIIRYLERIHNFNFDDVKKEILSLEGLQDAILAGTKEFKKDGKVFIIEDYKIVTIY